MDAGVGGKERVLRQAHDPLALEQGMETRRLVGAGGEGTGYQGQENRENERRLSSHELSPRRPGMLAQPFSAP